MHALKYLGRNGLIVRPAMNSPAQICAQNMPQQAAPSEEFVTYPGLEDANASYSNSLVPEARRRAARQTRNPTLLMGMQSRPGQKRRLDDYDEEAEAEEPLHKRPRAKAVRQADKGTRAHERTPGTTGREEDADKQAETEQSSRRGRSVYQDPGSLNMDARKSSQDAMAEAEERRKSADVERSSIAPLNITTGSSGILQNSASSRSVPGSLKKKVRFEDEVSDEVLEMPACLGNRFDETPK
ncbi:hypothetical protein SLS64_007421 [Diaporthe eres]|uniref:Uncharacterized protein n=1 Tax=Diaporthe eres TaxID=83184 RepID=A0ABR1NT66_DIAER